MKGKHSGKPMEYRGVDQQGGRHLETELRIRKINLKSLGMFCVLILTTCSTSMAQESKVKAVFEKTFLTFDLVLSNPNDHPIVLIRLGVKSKLRSNRSFGCLSGSGDLLPPEKYVVRFHVSHDETIVKAVPPLKIGPRDTVRVNVSIIPDATGACGYWASDVSVILIFDNGKRIQSSPELITKTEVDSFAERQPKDREIEEALKHPDAEARKLAIEHLRTSTIPRESIEFILGKKLEDPEKEVSAKAAQIAGKMRFGSLARKIASLLASSPDGAKEKYAYAKALEELREPVAIEALVSYLIDPEEEFPFAAKDALLALDHPNVPIKVRQLLVNKYWRAKIQPQRIKGINDAICEILVSYRDMESVKTLSDLIINSQVSGRCLVKIRGQMRENQIVQDPFIFALRPAAEASLMSLDQLSRQAAIEILCQLRERSVLERVIIQGLNDSQSSVKVSAAICAANHGYSAYTDKITSLYQSSQNGEEKEKYCEALKKLNAPCR